jgi:putative membrane protein
MEFFHTSLQGLINFASYFFASIVLLIVFSFVYVAITPHDEWKLVKQDKNIAAAIGLAGALIGFALALGSVVSNSIHLMDFVLWGVIALIAQLIAFALVRFVFMPELVQRIKDNEVSAGVILGATSVAVGVLNAACLTY